MIQLHTIIQFLLCATQSTCESSSRSAGQDILLIETGRLTDVLTEAVTAHHMSQLKHFHTRTTYFCRSRFYSTSK
jgi:hypothetical protein